MEPDRKMFDAYGIAPSGVQPDDCYLAVGRVLTVWENTEASMAWLFETLVRPSHPSFASQRAYLVNTSPAIRRNMIEQAGHAFVRAFPDEQVGSDLKRLLKLYVDAASRRNEFAHAIVAPHNHPSHGPPSFKGFFIGPNLNAIKKRADDFSATYLYTPAEAERFIADLQAFSGKVSLLVDAIRSRYLSAPPEVIARY